MQKCPYCGKVIKNEKDECIYCGGKIQVKHNKTLLFANIRNTMKRRTRIILIILSIIVMGVSTCLIFRSIIFGWIPPWKKPDIPGKILLVENDDIYISNANGNHRKNLTIFSKGKKSDPLFSHNQDKIAYIFHDGECDYIYTMDESGGNKINVSKGIDACRTLDRYEFKWTETNVNIIINEYSNSFAYIININNPSELLQIHKGDFNSFVCSPNGIRCYYKNPDSGYNIFEVDTNQITHFPEMIFRSWSPDNFHVLFTKYDAQEALYVYDTVLNLGKTLISDPVDINSSTWSPDGKIIAAVGRLDNFLYLINSDGTNKRIISTTVKNDSLRWSADGTMLAYIGEDAYLYLINADGTNERRISNKKISGFSHEKFYWSPDSNYILADVFLEFELISTIDYDVVDIIVPEDATYLWAQSWAPDSKWVIYSGELEGDWGITEAFTYAYSINERRSIKIDNDSWYIYDWKK